MNDIAIRVEGLGKLYRIGARAERYQSLREAVVDALKAPFRRKEVAPTLWALKDVSFQVNHGEVLGVIGRNGAGKSTLLKILSRITEPTEGCAEIHGRVGSLLEIGTGFHPELTGRENIFLNGAILGMKKRDIERQFDAIVDFSEIGQFLDTPVKHYSSGMFMRLAFSVAAHLESDILMVDEVLAVGDAKFQKKCMGKMGDVAAKGRTVIFVSHNMAAITRLCHRVILLNLGAMVAAGKPSDIISQYIFKEVSGTAYPVEPGQHNRGTREAVITTASIGDVAGAPKNEFFIGEPFVFHAAYEARRDFPSGIAFWAIICTHDGTPLLVAHQKDNGFMPVSKGAHALKMVFRKPGLMPGNYTAMVGIFDNDLNFLDWVDGFQNFSVSPLFQSGRAFDGRWGQVETEVEWQHLS